MLNKHEDMFHSLNVWHVRTLDHAFEAAINMGKWEEALDYGGRLIPGFKLYNGEYNPLLGLIHMKLGKINIYLNNMKDAKTNLRCAEKIIKITHGVDHTLYNEKLIPLLNQINCT